MRRVFLRPPSTHSVSALQDLLGFGGQSAIIGGTVRNPKPPFSFLPLADIDLANVGFMPHASYS
jgi:hypothetical protein